MANGFKSHMRFAVFILLLFFPVSVGAAPVLWSGDCSGRLGTVDLDTGDVSVIGRMGVRMTDIAFDTNGDLWGISFTGLYKIDKNTASTTFVGDLGITANSLIFDSNGVLYTANNSLYTINTATGAASIVGNGGDRYQSSGDLAFIGDDLYLSSNGVGGNTLLSIDTTDGSGSLAGNMGHYKVWGLASPDSEELYGLTGNEILSIDPLTGVSTSVLDYSAKGLGRAWGSAFISESAVPLPAAFWFLGSGLIAVVGIRKRVS